MAAAPRLEGICILVVEDEASLRDLLAEALSELGCRVSVVADANCALKAVASDARIDLMVTDVGLPGLNGCEMARIARATRPGLPVLFMTGQGDPAQSDVFPDEFWGLLEATSARGSFKLASGMEVIGKPFTLMALTTRLRRMLSADSPP